MTSPRTFLKTRGFQTKAAAQGYIDSAWDGKGHVELDSSVFFLGRPMYRVKRR